MISAASTVSTILRSTGRSGWSCPSLLSAVMQRWRSTVSLSSTLSISTNCAAARADRLQHGRHLAADLERHVGVHQEVAQRADDAIAERGERLRPPSASGRARHALDDAADEDALLAAAPRPRSRPWPLPDPRPAAAGAARDRRDRERSRSGVRPRAACAGPPAPTPPPSSTASARAASRFCARPGRARNAAIAARIEKSGKSPSCSMRPADRRCRARSDRAAPRSAPRGRDRAAALHLSLHAEIVGARQQRAAPGAALRAIGCFSSPRTAGCTVAIVGHLEQAERVEDLARRRPSAARSASPTPIRSSTGAAPLGVDAMLVDALLQVLDVLRRATDGRPDPAAEQRAGTPTPSRTGLQPSTAAKSRTARPPSAVAHAVDHRVDERLHAERLARPAPAGTAARPSPCRSSSAAPDRWP